MKNTAPINIGKEFFTSTTGQTSSNFQSLSGIGSLVSLFLNLAFLIAGVVLLFFFIMGGIGMISSAGKDDSQKLEEAKKTITSAVLGFIIVFASYWIVQLIGQLFGLQGLTVFQQLFNIQ
ncbi:MAG TPA: hypothetical protein VJ227_03940 [Patescibacteria group bacterium]|nr:hypothetical protein [Patescibacteria group bacterium]